MVESVGFDVLVFLCSLWVPRRKSDTWAESHERIALSADCSAMEGRMMCGWEFMAA